MKESPAYKSLLSMYVLEQQRSQQAQDELIEAQGMAGIHQQAALEEMEQLRQLEEDRNKMFEQTLQQLSNQLTQVQTERDQLRAAISAREAKDGSVGSQEGRRLMGAMQKELR